MEKNPAYRGFPLTTLIRIGDEQAAGNAEYVHLGHAHCARHARYRILGAVGFTAVFQDNAPRQT